MNRISEETRKQILDLHKQGKNTREIAEALGIARSTASMYTRTFEGNKRCSKCHEGPFPATYRYCPFCTADMRSEKELLIETLQRAAERLRPPLQRYGKRLELRLAKSDPVPGA